LFHLASLRCHGQRGVGALPLQLLLPWFSVANIAIIFSPANMIPDFGVISFLVLAYIHSRFWRTFIPYFGIFMVQSPCPAQKSPAATGRSGGRFKSGSRYFPRTEVVYR
jgi:hypothetical protein